MESANGACTFTCPCAYSGPLGDTYASVLVLGVDGLQRALEEMLADSKGAVANTSSYCAKCRRITPSLNAARSIQENAMHWRRQYAYYNACSAFISSWPRQTRGTRLRNRKKKHRAVDDASALA
jgi:hypothetical protein